MARAENARRIVPFKDWFWVLPPVGWVQHIVVVVRDEHADFVIRLPGVAGRVGQEEFSISPQNCGAFANLRAANTRSRNFNARAIKGPWVRHSGDAKMMAGLCRPQKIPTPVSRM